MSHSIRIEVARRTFQALLAFAISLFVGVGPAHAADVRLVKDIRPGGDSSAPLYLERFHGAVYFDAFTPTFHEGLWRSDGTRAGTKLVRDVYPGREDSMPAGLTPVGGKLFFSATDGVHGDELWKMTP